MIEKTAIIGTAAAVAGGVAAAAAKSFLAKNVAFSAADSVDTKGRKLYKRNLAGKNKVSQAASKAKYVAGAAVHGFKTRAFQTGLLHGIDSHNEHESALWHWVESTPGVGSEHPTFHYNLGYRLGKRLKHLPMSEKRERLAHIQRSVKSTPDFRAFPHFGVIHDGIDRVLKNQKNNTFDLKLENALGKGHKAGALKRKFKIQPGGFTRTLREQEDYAFKRRFVDDSKVDKAKKWAGKKSYQAASFAGKWLDADRAIQATIGKTSIPGKLKMYLLRKGLARLTPDHFETKKDKAANLAARVLINPRVRDVNEGARAFRNAMFADRQKTLKAGKGIAEGVIGTDLDKLRRRLSL